MLLLALLGSTYVLIRRQLRLTRDSQRALAQSEQKLATTLHSIGDGVLATDTEGRVTRMNTVAERLTGWTQEAALGRPIAEIFHIVHEETRLPQELPVQRALLTGEVQLLANHTALLRPDGQEIPIADSAAPIRNADGEVTGVVLVFRDETLTRQARRALRQQNAELELRVQQRTAELRDSQQHLQGVIGAVPAMLAYVDTQQRYVYVNEAYRQRFAPDRGDIVGCTVREILGEERYAIAAPMIAAALHGQRQNYDWHPFAGIWQAIEYTPRHSADGTVLGYYVLGTDITERKRTEDRIQHLNQELAQRVQELEYASRGLRTLSAGNRTMLRATHEQGLLQGMCDAIVTIGGYGMAVVAYTAAGAPPKAMAQSGLPGGLPALQAHWDTGTEVQTQYLAQLRTEGYCPVPALPGVHPPGVACAIQLHGNVTGALLILDARAQSFEQEEIALLGESADDLAFGIATLRARAMQQEAQDAMYRMTRTDVLTGLPNELHFTELLNTAIEAGAQPPQPFAVLQANIERLSEINDALGFGQGDQILRDFGRRVVAAAPPHAQVARLRGDEFAILLPGCERETALHTAHVLEALLSQPFQVADIALQVSAKMGLSLFPDHGSTAHDLYRHVDIAVQQAKKRGVSVAVFDPVHNPNRSHRLNMAGELQRAIQSGDLRLYLQPKVSFHSGQVCGAEGLVRWQHPTRGLVPPGEFIELAEHTGLIQPLTEWVIETAMRQTQDWERQDQPLPIAVNLSARNLRDESLLEKIRDWQTTLGTQASWLELEITESAVMEDAELALRVLHSLRESGISLYIDDFGTGYSSLSYLQKLPVEYIKIDQSFVRQIDRDKDSALIVRSTIDLAHDLGHKTVAEGVETQAQWDLLASLGCDMAQGYLIARPMPAEDFLGWLAEFRAKG